MLSGRTALLAALPEVGASLGPPLLGLSGDVGGRSNTTEGVASLRLATRMEAALVPF